MAESHDQTLMDEELLLMDEQSSFLRWNLFLVKDTVKVVEITKYLEYYINLVNNAAAGFGRTDFKLERSYTLGKMLSNSISFSREIIHERKSQLIQQTS